MDNKLERQGGGVDREIFNQSSTLLQAKAHEQQIRERVLIRIWTIIKVVNINGFIITKVKVRRR